MAEERIATPAVEATAGDGTFRLSATIDVSRIVELVERDLDVGLAVVVQATDDILSYWAAAHPGKRPDFHARDAFSLRLGPVLP